MKYIYALLLTCSISFAFADGLAPMKLEKVVSEAETIIEIEVTASDHKQEVRKEGDKVRSIKMVTKIEGKMIKVLKGEYKLKEVKIVHTDVVVKGAWVETWSSGQEGQIKKGDKCFVLIQKGGLVLRVEKADSREALMKLLKPKKEHN